MTPHSRRAIISAVAAVSGSLAGCTDYFDSSHELVHVELINAQDEANTFSVLVEEDGEPVVWKSFTVEGGAEAAGSVGQLVPELEIESELASPLSLRFHVDDQHEDLVLENGTFEWTADRTAADIHVSFWLQADGTLDVRRDG